jgi:hypothetical protein
MLNKKLLSALMAAIIVSSATGVYAYSSIVNVTDANVQVDNSSVVINNSNVTLGENVTVVNPNPIASSTSEPKHAEATVIPTPTSTPDPHRVAVYEWTLRSDYVNNTAWLNGAKMHFYFYHEEFSFKNNYRMYLAQFWMTYNGEAPASVIMTDFVYDDVSGYTKLTCDYRVDAVMQIESILPSISDSNGWTVKFI